MVRASFEHRPRSNQVTKLLCFMDYQIQCSVPISSSLTTGDSHPIMKNEHRKEKVLRGRQDQTCEGTPGRDTRGLWLREEVPLQHRHELQRHHWRLHRVVPGQL